MGGKMKGAFQIVCVAAIVAALGSLALASDLIHTTATLSQERYCLAATTAGGKTVFGGGLYFDSGDIFTDVVDIYDANTQTWSTATLSEARYCLSATAVGGKAIFAGGIVNLQANQSSYSNTVDIFDSATGLWTTSSLSHGRGYIAATSVGNKAMFAGGSQASLQGSNVVDIYDDTTGLWTTGLLSEGRQAMAATSVGNKAIFAGGNSQGFKSTVDIFDAETDTWSTATLSQARTLLAATTVGSKAIFAGGSYSNLTTVPDHGYSSVVDIYDAETDTWSVASLSQPRSSLAATTVGNLAIFAGGRLLGQNSDVVDIYDADTGTWSTTTLSEARSYPAATTIGESAMIAGGRTASSTYSNVVDVLTIPEPTTLSFVSLSSLALIRRRKRGVWK